MSCKFLALGPACDAAVCRCSDKFKFSEEAFSTGPSHSAVPVSPLGRQLVGQESSGPGPSSGAGAPMLPSASDGCPNLQTGHGGWEQRCVGLKGS